MQLRARYAPTPSTQKGRRLVLIYPGEKPSLPTGRATTPTPGSHDTEGTVPQRSRAGPVTRRPAQQQDGSVYGTLSESQRGSRPTKRVRYRSQERETVLSSSESLWLTAGEARPLIEVEHKSYVGQTRFSRS